MPTVEHPIFARFYTHMAGIAERRFDITSHRREMLEGIAGRVVEIGPGNGLNFPLYPDSVRELIAVEPEPYLRARATEAAGDATIPITVVEGSGERLPLEDDSFDAAVTSLVLCSVADPRAALAEIRRVLRPGGAFHFYEHVRSTDRRHARFQYKIDAVWPRFAGGCRTSRDTIGSIERSGFVVERLRRFDFPGVLAYPVAPHVIGRARKSDMP